MFKFISNIKYRHLPRFLHPGRYSATFKLSGVVSSEGIIGYDAPMETYFFQSGDEDTNGLGYPSIWLGMSEQFTDISALYDALNRQGVRLISIEYY